MLFTVFQQVEWIPKLYITVMFISSSFLFITVLVYLLIWNIHNIHGWTVFSLSVSMFFMLIFLGTSRAMQLTLERNEASGSGSCVFVGMSHFLRKENMASAPIDICTTDMQIRKFLSVVLAFSRHCNPLFLLVNLLLAHNLEFWSMVDISVGIILKIFQISTHWIWKMLIRMNLCLSGVWRRWRVVRKDWNVTFTTHYLPLVLPLSLSVRALSWTLPKRKSCRSIYFLGSLDWKHRLLVFQWRFWADKPRIWEGELLHWWRVLDSVLGHSPGWSPPLL